MSKRASTRSGASKKAKAVAWKPEKHHALVPYLMVKDANEAISLYTEVFGAKETFRMPGKEEGTVAHMEFSIDDSQFYMGDTGPDMKKLKDSKPSEGSSFMCLWVPDVDATVKKAVEKGFKVVKEVADQFWGDRTGLISDPLGLKWYIMTHKKDVTPEEMEAAAAAMKC